MPSPKKTHAWIWLTLIYFAAVGIHFLCLWPQAQFPLIATDEAQYISVGDNIRLGHGFTTRGEFHSALPPLYPLFVAFAHSWGPNVRTSALFFSCAFMCLALFPAYRLARLIGLEGLTAYLVGAAAAFLPHTLFAGMYMTETVSYPLFMAAFWMFALWLEQPTPRGALFAGALLSLLLLTKLAAWSFAAAILVTLIAVAVSRSRPTGFARQAACIVGLVIATQLLWQWYKLAHRSAGLGMYGRILSDTPLHLTFGLFGAYLADFLLAPGLLVAAPLFLWFKKQGSARFPIAVLLASTMFFQITIHGVLEAGLVGELKERLFLYSLPLMAMFAIRGMGFLKDASIAYKILFIAIPLLLVLPVHSALHYNPAVDVPWASAAGTIAGPKSWIPVDSFTPRHFLRIAMALIIAIGALILWTPRARVQAVAAALVLTFYSLTFVCSAKQMDELAGRAGYPVSRITGFLSRANVHANDRLIICGNIAYYQESHRFTPVDQYFVAWQQRFDLHDLMVLQIESLGHYDVRMARSPEQIKTWMRPGDHLLSATRFSDLRLVAFQDPYYIYTTDKPLTTDPRPLYITDITSEVGYGWPLGLPPAQWTYHVLAQPKPLPPGHYRATIYVTASKPFAAEVVRKNNEAILFSQPGSETGVTTFDFATPGDSPVVLRLSGPGISSDVFKEAKIEYLSPYVTPEVPAKPTGQFITANPTVDPDLRLVCDFSSINGEAAAPLHTITQGDPLQVNGWSTGPSSELPGERWVELTSSHGNVYYLKATPRGGVYFSASANTAPLPPDLYKITTVQIDGNQEERCAYYQHLNIQGR